MRTIWLTLCFFCPVIILSAQEQEEVNKIAEQQIENLVERDEIGSDDDSYQQYLTYFKSHPINLNQVDGDELLLLNVISEWQIASFLRFRKLMGPLIDIHELQAIPGWDIGLIRKIRPYITVNEIFFDREEFEKRFREGNNSFLVRAGKVLRKESKPGTSNNYLGSTGSFQFRYKYQYENLMRWGFAGDKDAGETLFNHNQKSGFDFYTGHLFIQKIHKIKTIALGDYTVNLGQGLIQWQSFAFKKSSEILNVKRQGPVLRPYLSVGEFNFHRGAAITLQEKRWELTLFTSLRKLSANVQFDSIHNEKSVSSLLTSGYHRTISEMEDRNSLQMKAFGGSLRYKWVNGSIGVNSINYNFSLPFKKETSPYNLYAIDGNKLKNYSADYSYTVKNAHLFGEVAMDDHGRMALLNGLLASLDPGIDIALSYRRIHKGYQSLFSNAFTEKSLPSNENGLYGGISLRPSYGWRLDAYVDIYHFPWLSAFIDAPAVGNEYLVQLTYMPAKNLEIYTRFRSGSQPINGPTPGSVVGSVVQVEKSNFRIHISYSPEKSWKLSSRVELVNYNNSETGFLGYTDLFFTSASGLFGSNLRVQYFETDSYNSRIYAFENDVLFSYSVPSFYNKGIRWYLNSRIAFKKKHYWNRNFNMEAWIKMAQTIDFNGIKSDLNIVGTSVKQSSEVKFQFFLGWQKNNN